MSKESEIFAKISAIKVFAKSGMEEVKRVYPEYVAFVEENKDREPMDVITELNDSLPPITD